MNLKQALLNPEISKRVYEKYPINKKERQGCAIEKAHMDDLRIRFAKRLIEEKPNEKAEYK